jgi:hypothetical protein
MREVVNTRLFHKYTITTAKDRSQITCILVQNSKFDTSLLSDFRAFQDPSK